MIGKVKREAETNPYTYPAVPDPDPYLLYYAAYYYKHSNVYYDATIGIGSYGPWSFWQPFNGLYHKYVNRRV